MATVTKSAKLFLERYDIIPTRRGPRARVNLQTLPIHTMSLKRPLPLPENVPPSTQLTVNDPWHLGSPPE